jgi:hypothetical protein
MNINANTHNLDAENRNAQTVFPRIIRHRQQRCCSFCYRTNHNIRRCTDGRLTIFENLCNGKKEEFINEQYPNIRFKHWLFNIYMENCVTIRAFAISKCGCTLNKDAIHYIDNITSYFYMEQHQQYILNQNTDRTDREEWNQYFYELLTDNWDQNLRENIINIINTIHPQVEDWDQVLRENTTNIIDIAYITNIAAGTPVEEERKYKIESICELKEGVNLDELCNCNICWEDIEKRNFVKLGCGHEFCKECLHQSMKNDKRAIPLCSYCRSEITNVTCRTEDINNEFTRLKAQV